MLETTAILLIIWAGTMNYSWFTHNRKDEEAWHWTIFLGPVAYENHVRDERNHDLRVVAKITTAAADAWRRDYIWR
jgi:hypothetical protein